MFIQLDLADSRCCSLLYALWPEGLTFWAMEFPAQLMIPWGIDL